MSDPELRWLARQKYPVWGGHLTRREPLNDNKMKTWLDLGWIAVSDDERGYVITAAGRKHLAEQHQAGTSEEQTPDSDPKNTGSSG